MKIQVLGSGCPSCKNLHKAVEEVVKKLELNVEVEYSTDITEIVKLGAMSSPVFAIDGKLMSSGKVLSKEEIEKVILEELKNEDLCCADKNVCNIDCSPAKKDSDSSSGSCCCGGKC